MELLDVKDIRTQRGVKNEEDNIFHNCSDILPISSVKYTDIFWKKCMKKKIKKAAGPLFIVC